MADRIRLIAIAAIVGLCAGVVLGERTQIDGRDIACHVTREGRL